MLTEPHLCNCGELHKPVFARKETLSKIKVEILFSAGELVSKTMTNNFMLKDVAACTEPSHYNNFQKLRYHGLIAKVKEDGKVVPGQWLITRNGWGFLRGRKDIPKYVLIKDNHVVERAPERLTLSQVWSGAPYLETQFEYFDDAGNPIGLRPAAVSPSSQVALI